MTEVPGNVLFVFEAALNSPPPGNTVVVLLTDGQPTCGANEAGIAGRLLAKKIKTYVVGLPGARGSSVLDQVAIAGGTAPQNCLSNCFLTPTDGAALERSLAEVATTTVDVQTKITIDSCSFAVASRKLPPGRFTKCRATRPTAGVFPRTKKPRR